MSALSPIKGFCLRRILGIIVFFIASTIIVLIKTITRITFVIVFASDIIVPDWQLNNTREFRVIRKATTVVSP